jgi:hypothetical protein
MAKDRKTVSIDMLLDYANGYLASDYAGGDSEDAQARRQGVIDLLEASLHAVKRYRGFCYLDGHVITKAKPGIRWLHGQEPSHTFENCDKTRRRYA